jgi:CheY-like chemotaxis protein
VAEDDTVNRAALQIMLTRNGFQPDLAPNGLRAVELWEQGAYELIVMDVQMPVMNGIEAVQAIRHREKEQESGHVPILALTAHASREDVDICLTAGMDAYLAKPVDLEEFIAVIHEMLGKGPLS